MNTMNTFGIQIARFAACVGVAFASAATMPTQTATASVGAGYRSPFPVWMEYKVTGTPGTHSGGKSAYDYTSRNGSAGIEGATFVAARAGQVVEVKDKLSACGDSTLINSANVITIRHSDGSQAIYVHLQKDSAMVSTGQWVSQGQALGKVGKVGYTNCAAHLHFEVTGQTGSIPFDDVGAPELGMLYLSGNGAGGLNAYKFIGSASSNLFFDQAGARINLTVCADNLPGQVVYVQLSRPGRTFDLVTQRASTRCVTFWDLDGVGMTYAGTDYTTRAALNRSPNPSWSGTGCAVATGGAGLCDTKRR